MASSNKRPHSPNATDPLSPKKELEKIMNAASERLKRAMESRMAMQESDTSRSERERQRMRHYENMTGVDDIKVEDEEISDEEISDEEISDEEISDEEMTDSDIEKQVDHDDDMGQKLDADIANLIRIYWKEIKSSVIHYKKMSRYNFQTSSLTPQTVIEKLAEVYHTQASPSGRGSIFKANIQTGSVLMDRVTGELRWYHPGFDPKFNLNDAPLIITSRQDLSRAEKKLSGQDFFEKLTNIAPNSRWIFLQTTNIVITVTALEGFPLRGDLHADDFPETLTNRNDVYCFITTSNGKNLLNDGLCLFRCLAVFLTKKHHQKCENEAKRLARIYCIERGEKLKNFPGIAMGELEHVENCFDVGIKVYSMSCENLDCKALYRLPQEGKKNGICQVFVFKDKHFCLIKPGHEESFLGGFQCKKCTRFVRTNRDRNRHESKCKGGSRIVVKSGTYQRGASLVERLEKLGTLLYNATDVFQKYFIVFDAESKMEKTPDDMFAAKTIYEYEHKPLVLCAATNIPGETAKIFINKENPKQPAQYLKHFLLQVEHWRLMARDINLRKTKYIFDYLDGMIELLETNPKQVQYMKRFQNVRNTLYNHMETINILSFNGRSYDIPLMREHLLPLLNQFSGDTLYTNNYFGEEGETSASDSEDGEIELSDEIVCGKQKKQKPGITFLLKQGASRYDAILANKIRLLDVLNYLGGQSVSLRMFVRDFAKDQQEKVDKAWFPYKFLKSINSIEDMKQIGLPAITDFTSDIDNGNTLGKNELEIAENYIEFTKLWHKNQCRTLYDWLLEYVKIDCLCMIPAVECLQNQWHHRKIDLFSNHCTIQSAAVPYLLSTAPKIYFTLPDEVTMNLFREKGITGGLAEIFTRHQEAGVTTVGPDSSTKTELIESLDSNSQYLAALASEMPAGPYLVRKADRKFKPELCGEKRATSAVQWMDYMASKMKFVIRHKLNGGEHVFYNHGQQMRPDGYCHELDNIYEFDGCETHNCDRPNCPILGQVDGEQISKVTGKTYNQMRKQTEKRNEIWRSKHANLIVKQECEFLEELNMGGELTEFLKNWMLGPKRFGHNTHELSEKSMTNKLKSGEIFGFALVDLECDPNHPNYEKLKMFPPIIRHLNINRNMITKEVLKIGDENGIMFMKPRRNLVACMTGKQVLMYTPLLKYLCEIGVKLTKIHQVVQYQANQYPFKEYETIIANDRRDGDRTGNTVKTNMSKHLGASAWGKFAYNPLKRNTYRIVTDSEVNNIINGPVYVSHLELGGDYCEVELKPRTIKYDLPVQIAVAVFGAAKLNLLRFVHSFVLKYFDHTKLAICGSDTDSVILSWGDSIPERLVHPHLQHEYNQDKYKYLVDDRSSAREAYTKRQPGLFKVEKQAKGFIGLSAKCYIMADETENTVKHAAKGVSAKTNTEILRFETFKAALYQGKHVEATNISFRTVKNRTGIYTIRAKRIGLQPFYIKRKLLAPDLIFTEPLDESLEEVENI